MRDITARTWRRDLLLGAALALLACTAFAASAGEKKEADKPLPVSVQPPGGGPGGTIPSGPMAPGQPPAPPPLAGGPAPIPGGPGPMPGVPIPDPPKKPDSPPPGQVPPPVFAPQPTGLVMSGKAGVRFAFKFEPNTPLKDLLPVPPKVSQPA